MTKAGHWERIAKTTLKKHLRARGKTYRDLVTGLERIGVIESEPNIRNKISRGKFSAAFLIQCFYATEGRHIWIEED